MSNKSPSKDARELIKYAESLGFVLVRCRKHIIMKLGDRTVSISKTPSDNYAMANARGDLDRAVKGVSRG